MKTSRLRLTALLGSGLLSMLLACGASNQIATSTPASAPPAAPAAPVVNSADNAPAAPAAATATERVIIVTATPGPTATDRVRVVVVTAKPKPTATEMPNDLVVDLDNPPGGANFQRLKVSIVAFRFNKNGTSNVGFQVLARRKDKPKDGDGIQSVQFRITDEDGVEVYNHRENSMPYCAFQESSGTKCRVLLAKAGDLWRASDPDSGDDQLPFRDGTFVLNVDVAGKDGESWSAQSTFKIKTVSGNGQQPVDVVGCQSGQTAINDPSDDSELHGVVEVFGTATCDNLWYYKFEIEDERCDKGLCFVAGPAQPIVAGRPFAKDVSNGLLMRWDTRKLPNGSYTLRLTAVGQGGFELPQVARVRVQIEN